MNYVEGPLLTENKSDSDTEEESGSPASSKKKARRGVSQWLAREVKTAPPPETKERAPEDKRSGSEDVREAEAPTESLSQEEMIEVAAMLREEARRARQSETSDLEKAVHEALDEFDAKIIDEKLDPGVALNSVLAERQIELSPEVAAKEDLPPEATFWLSPPRPTEASEPSTPTVIPPEGGNLPPIRPAEAYVPEWNAPSALPTNRVEYIDRGGDDLLSGALMGGIIGYLIGRRRGKIKTQKKLLPIKKKLEKQVVNLEKQLMNKEYQIRDIISDKIRAEKPAPKVKTPESLATPKPVTAESLHPKTKASERIGQLVVEKTPPPKVEHIIEDQSPAAERLSEKRIETMNRAELLKVSQKIKVEGSSLRQIYETHLVGERGLRRLVNEHFKGGDLSKALRREIVEREIDFERDPALRDMALKQELETSTFSQTENDSVSLNETLDQMISRVEDSVPANEEAAFYKAKANYEAKQFAHVQNQRQIINGVLITTITLLIAIIVALYLTRY